VPSFRSEYVCYVKVSTHRDERQTSQKFREVKKRARTNAKFSDKFSEFKTKYHTVNARERNARKPENDLFGPRKKEMVTQLTETPRTPTTAHLENRRESSNPNARTTTGNAEISMLVQVGGEFFERQSHILNLPQRGGRMYRDRR
jgi:hypothetical protein